MADKREAPGWLLNETGLENGVLSEDCTILTGRRGSHLQALWAAGGLRDQEWEIIRKRLVDEGFCE